MNNYKRITSIFLILGLILSSFFLYKHSTKKDKYINLYLNKKYTSQPLNKIEKALLEKFQNANKKCLSTIQETSELDKVYSFLIENEKIHKEKIKVSYKDLMKILDLKSSNLFKEISKCHFLSRKQILKDEKEDFKIAQKKLTLLQRINLFYSR